MRFDVVGLLVAGLVQKFFLVFCVDGFIGALGAPQFIRFFPVDLDFCEFYSPISQQFHEISLYN